LALAVSMTLGALFLGMCGYHFLNTESWIDALVDAAMILGGMGPVRELHGIAAKVFAALYALFSGLFLIGTAAILLAPWVHLLLHRLHADAEEGQGRARKG